MSDPTDEVAPPFMVVGGEEIIFAVPEGTIDTNAPYEYTVVEHDGETFIQVRRREPK